MKIAITGARSYSGKYIARRLLARGEDVVTLTGHPGRPDPFQGRVEVHPLDFDHAHRLVSALQGCDVLVNTYWIRFDQGANTQQRAVENTRRLIMAALEAAVPRVIHISITNPSLDSPLPYFSGKAENERTVQDSGLTYAIVRPTVLFGAEDILINNIAFLLRRFPLFCIAGDGSYKLQPVFVDDLAALVEDSVYRSDSCVMDAVGPEVFSFGELVSLIARTIDHPRPIMHVSPQALLLAARALSALLGDVLLTDHELHGLMSNLLVSPFPPHCATRLSGWLAENRDSLGRTYASELQRHYI